MEWDDLRHFVELARAGTLSGAAKRMDVTHTTISRRLQRLEQRIGEPLFLRSRQGYALTARGEALWIEAQRIEAAFARIGQQLPERPEGLSGLVRIGCTEGFGTQIIAPLITRLQQKYPALQIDLIVQPRPILLTKNEADILITIDRPERGPYAVARLTDYSLHLYASPGYLDRAGPPSGPEDLTSHRLIGYVGEHSPARDLPNVTQLGPADLLSIRSTSIIAQKAMVASGAGIALLPDFIVSETDDLVRVLDQVAFHRSFWMIVPVSLRQIARIRVVADTIAELIRQQRSRLIR
ncbi:LysR family transcriptional regulator [Paracoccus sp. Z118]|uniref:LysR family transcriptional regulator n=1 Tax=Paracoccus sp. Z118 TaxID=2851017 RepID=UPI001C2C5D5C|nr:LysR family transcriptional regulator [Paracoccus sp. Z118]MBV0890881.1 LysR family transcriptional regulator [Paracoccus sp. Z118]